MNATSLWTIEMRTSAARVALQVARDWLNPEMIAAIYVPITTARRRQELARLFGKLLGGPPK
jgi:hypothetical protein